MTRAAEGLEARRLFGKEPHGIAVQHNREKNPAIEGFVEGNEHGVTES